MIYSIILYTSWTVVFVSNWHVKMTETAEEELKQLIAKGKILKTDVKVILRWVDEMEEFGPEYISNSKEWHDHALDRNWTGYRSSAFSSSGRIIYRIIDNDIIGEVHRVTAIHDYKK